MVAHGRSQHFETDRKEDMTLAELAPYLVLIALVAALYSSVGHGGASGYIAVLSLITPAIGKAVVSSDALTMNLLVSAIAFYAYWRQGFFRARLVWPFLVTSVPAAFVGAKFKISEEIYCTKTRSDGRSVAT